MKKALITGITGQDGSYLAELLLEKGYEVHGIVRRVSQFNTSRIDHIHKDAPPHSKKVILHYGDLTDSSNLNRLLDKIEPHEIYNLAAQSHVKVSFEVPEYTAEVDAVGTLRLLDAIRDQNIQTRYYQASTSELYGKAQEIPQTEKTPFYPRSPYAVAKLYAHWATINYREAYNLHASNGILFNHESPRRGPSFVTRKVTLSAAKIKAGQQDKLFVGNLDAKRDWGYAPDYVNAMWLMLQQPEPDDYVVATGETHSVREFIEKTFSLVGIPIVWEGTGQHEMGRDKNTGKTLIEIDPAYYRPTEVDYLLGDPTKAMKMLQWKPTVSFDQLIEIMVKADCDALTHYKANSSTLSATV